MKTIDEHKHFFFLFSEVDLDKSIRKSIDDLKDDESDNVMQSYGILLEKYVNYYHDQSENLNLKYP